MKIKSFKLKIRIFGIFQIFMKLWVETRASGKNLETLNFPYIFLYESFGCKIPKFYITIHQTISWSFGSQFCARNSILGWIRHHFFVKIDPKKYDKTIFRPLKRSQRPQTAGSQITFFLSLLKPTSWASKLKIRLPKSFGPFWCPLYSEFWNFKF
jgi:hypothetical protein